MWAGHGGTGDGVGGRVGSDPGREDTDTWSKDIDRGAEVGEGGAGIVDIGGTDGDGVWCGGWGDIGGVLVLVTGGDDDSDTGGDDGLDGVVGGGRVASSEGHGEDGLLGETEGLGVGGNPLDARDDTRVGAGSISTEDLDGNESGLLGDTVGRASDGTGTVSSVSVLIGVGRTGDVVGSPDGTSTELSVSGVDTGINNVDAGALASGGVVDVGGGSLDLVGDAAETPWGTGLGGQGGGVDLLILLDVGDLFEMSV